MSDSEVTGVVMSASQSSIADSPFPSPEHLAAWSRALRAKHKISQQKLGAAIGTTQQNVCLWESGNSDPSYSLIHAVVQKFGAGVEAPAPPSLSAFRLDLEDVRTLIVVLELLGNGIGMERGDAVSTIALTALNKLDEVLARVEFAEAGQ